MVQPECNILTETALAVVLCLMHTISTSWQDWSSLLHLGITRSGLDIKHIYRSVHQMIQLRLELAQQV